MKKKLEIKLNMTEYSFKNNIEYIEDLPTPKYIDGYTLVKPPPIPKECVNKDNNFDYKICSKCHYNINNQATLFEFGKIVDNYNFNDKAYVGVFGTDTRIKCNNLLNQF